MASVETVRRQQSWRYVKQQIVVNSLFVMVFLKDCVVAMNVINKICVRYQHSILFVLLICPSIIVVSTRPTQPDKSPIPRATGSAWARVANIYNFIYYLQRPKLIQLHLALTNSGQKPLYRRCSKCRLTIRLAVSIVVVWGGAV